MCIYEKKLCTIKVMLSDFSVAMKRHQDQEKFM